METGTPWELTREEFERQLVSTGRREWYGPGPYGLLVAHEEEIRAALRHGQLVPERVLQNYPHLLEQAMKAKLKLKPATKTAPTRSTPKKQLTAKPGVPSLKGDDLHAYGQR